MNKITALKEIITIIESIAPDAVESKPLTWGETARGTMTWDEANEWCEKQGGRLPTSTELHEAFLADVPGFVASHYWSRTEVPGVSANAYRVYMYSGYVYSGVKSGGGYVRCVFD